MKNFIIFTVIISLILLVNKSAFSEEIDVNQTFSADTVFNPFPSQEMIYTLKITGSIEMHSLTSLVRVLVNTDKGEYMVFECYPLISTDSIFDFLNYCDETCYLDGVTPDVIRLEIIDATIDIDNFYFDKEFVENAISLQYQEKKKKDHEKVDLMNKKITELEMDWIAGNTSLVDLFYQDKKSIYNEDYNLLGYDCYSGGIYQVIGQVYEPVTDFSLVDQWDWRNRHSANVPGTPYFDGDDENFTGWLTIPKDQNVPNYCGACGIFGSTGALESVINLYYNQYLDLDLSEQHLLACVPTATCGNVNPHLVMEYLKDSGVVTEACSPYLGVDEEGDCEDPDIVCTSPDTKVRITSYTEFQGSPASDWEDIFEEMVLSGPISLTINNGTHYVALIGWHYNEVSEELYIIYKESYGPDYEYGVNGFAIQQVSGNYQNATSQHIPYFDIIPVQPIVQVRDADGDGYWFWGLGDCDTCQQPPDCDDSNPFKGPYSYLADYSCDCDDTYGNDTLRITSITPWPGIIKIENPVSIENGGQLTITGTVYVPPLGQIVIKKGGQLIIDGGKITKSCDQLWKGIQVWGDSSLSQYPTSNQGYLKMMNGGCIEYAKTAVFVGRIAASDTLFNYSGGIVSGEDAIFLNNEVDVEFLPFINDNPYTGKEMDNFSHFWNCTFKMYDPEFVLPKPIAHVILDGVNGVDFYSCSFKTQEVQNYPIDKNDRGIGILAFDSKIWVKGTCTNAIIPCNSYDSSYFENLRYGIKAFNTGGNNYFSVYTAVFDSNVAGIYLSGFHQPSIVSSFFYTYLEQSNIPGPEDPFFGCLYLDGSTGYHIENNHFAGPLIYVYGPNHIAKIGLYIRNSGEDDNEIYNNLFSGLEAGIVAEGVNKGDGTGLCLKCNDFSHCLNDLMVIPNPFRIGDRYVGIKENQGADTTLGSALAGNTFTSEIQSLQAFDNGGNYKCYWSYYNHEDADHINYYHHAENLYVVTYPSDGNYTDESITLHDQQVPYVKVDACPSGLNNNPHYKSSEDPWLEIAEADIRLFPLQNSYDSLLDGGSTENLDAEIISSYPDEALELRQQLLADSPYLSDTVMTQAIYKENVLPNAMIRDILSANPQSAKSSEILEAVDDRYDPMPDYMMAEIMQGKDLIGALESLESKMSYWEQYRTRAVNRLIREYLTDSTITDREDSLISLFQNESDLQSKYRLAFTYWENKQEEQAMNALSAIPSDFELSSLEQDIHQGYLDYFDILQMMRDSSLNARQLDSVTVESLKTIMNSNLPLVSAFARGLLVKGRYIDFTETVSFPSEVKSYPSYYYLDPKETDFPEDEHLVLFPNPSGDFVVAYFNTIDQGQKGTIIIDDIQGKRLAVLPLNSEQNQLVINLADYPNGIYFVSLIINNKLIESKKLSKGSH